MKYTFLLLLSAIACSTSQHEGAIQQKIHLVEFGGPVILSSGNNNNWYNSSCGVNDGPCRISGDASGSVITGINETYYGDRDVAIWFWNEGSTPVTIAHNNSNSSTNNRIHLRAGSNLALSPGYGVWLQALVDWTTDPYTPLGWHEIGFHAVDSAVASTPSRSLGTAFQPSTHRLSLVTFSASADCTITLSGGQEGRVELLSDSSNPPTTIRADVAGCRNTGTVVAGITQVVGSRGTASYLVPAGDFVLLRSVNVTGTPSYAITRQTEQTL